MAALVRRVASRYSPAVMLNSPATVERINIEPSIRHGSRKLRDGLLLRFFPSPSRLGELTTRQAVSTCTSAPSEPGFRSLDKANHRRADNCPLVQSDPRCGPVLALQNRISDNVRPPRHAPPKARSYRTGEDLRIKAAAFFFLDRAAGKSAGRAGRPRNAGVRPPGDSAQKKLPASVARSEKRGADPSTGAGRYGADCSASAACAASAISA